MQVSATKIPEVKLIQCEQFTDHRGVFVRQWDATVWEDAGIGPFVQDNVSVSKTGVLRGLHFQLKSPQGKLVTVHTGKIYDVAVDIRLDSSTYGHWVGVVLRAGDHQQLWVPPGFAHGFFAMEGPATVHYRCTTIYDPEDQHGIRWDDPSLAIDWPTKTPLLSDRDKKQHFLND